MSVGNVERIIKKYAPKIRPEHPNRKRQILRLG